MTTTNHHTPLRRPALAGSPVVDPACWVGSDMATRNDWVRVLAADEIRDLGAMARGVRREIGGDVERLMGMGREAFALGAFAAVVEEVWAALRDGRGFVMLRGLPVWEWARTESLIAYWALGRHIGAAMPTNYLGDLIGHVRDLGHDYAGANVRGYETRDALDFHVDQCDVVSLLCLAQSRRGGLSKIASSAAIHNAILARRPDAAAALGEPYCWSRIGEIPGGHGPWHESPVFNFVGGTFSAACGRNHIEKGHAFAETPDLSPLRREALDLVQDTAHELSLDMVFEPGDIQLLNNAVIVHARSEFEDWPEADRRRHLWRLWLIVPGFRPRAPYFENWVDGIRVPGSCDRILLEPGAADSGAASAGEGG